MADTDFPVGGNPVPKPDIDTGSRALIVPGRLLIEEIFRNLINALFAIREPEPIFPEGVVTREDFFEILRTGVIPRKMVPFLPALAPDRSVEFWEGVITYYDRALAQHQALENTKAAHAAKEAGIAPAPVKKTAEKKPKTTKRSKTSVPVTDPKPKAPEAVPAPTEAPPQQPRTLGPADFGFNPNS